MLSLAQNCEKAAQSFISNFNSSTENNEGNIECTGNSSIVEEDQSSQEIQIRENKTAAKNINNSRKKLSFSKKLNRFFKKFNEVKISYIFKFANSNDCKICQESHLYS
ncbi:MAG: hypothetical protein MHMPM18_004490 [Marteilia pararefringens]